MHHHYPITTVVLTAALGLLGVNLLAQPMKPAVSRNAAPRNAGTPDRSNAAYFSTQTYDASGKLINQQGEVFCQQKPEAANSDFAVFGTIPTDGLQHIPFGGEMSQVPTRFPQVALPKKWTAIPLLMGSDQGLITAHDKRG